MPETPADNKTLNSSNFFGMGVKSGLERRIENNEKKITSLKNILKIRKVASKKLLLASSEEGGERNQTIITNNFGDRLKNISEALGVLFRIKKQEVGFDKKVASQDLRDDADKDKAEREKELESKKKEEEGSKKSVNLKLPSIPAFGGLFDTVKTFFGNILAGSIVLKMLNWVNDPENQENINKFTGFLKENALAIVGLIAFIAGLGIVATLVAFTGALVGGIVALAPIIAFLLKAMAIGAAVAATVVGGKWLWDKSSSWMHERFAGGKASAAGDLANEAKLREAGISQNWLDRRLGRYTVHTRKMSPSGKMTDYVSSKSYKELTDEQKAAVDAFKAESKRMNDLEKERNQKLKELGKSFIDNRDNFYTVKRDGTDPEWVTKKGYGKGQKIMYPEKMKELRVRRAQITAEYDQKISAPLSKTPDIKPKVQSSSPPKQVSELKTDTSQKMSIQKTVPSREISQPLTGGEGTVKFIDLGEGGGDQQQSSSGTESGNSGTWFSSRSGRTGNAVTLGVINNA